MWDWLLLAVGLGTVLYWYLTWHQDYWRSVGVPTMPGALPGLGHMWDTFFLKSSAQWMFYEFYRKATDLPAIGLYSFRDPALLVRDLDLVQEVLVREFSSFHDNVIEVDETIDKHLSRNPFFLKGDKWKVERQKINSALSPAKVKAMLPLIDNVFDELTKYLEKRSGEDIDVSLITGLFTSEVVAKCAFGMNGGAFTAPDHGEFYQKGTDQFKSIFYNPLMILLLTFFPFTRMIFRIGFFSKTLTEYFIDVIRQVDDYRAINPEKTPKDFLQYHLDLKHNDPDFTMDDVVAQCMSFYTNVFESTAVFSALAIYHIAIDPDIQEALRCETKSVETLSYDNIAKLNYLDRVVKETMRKYGNFALAKRCTKKYVLQKDGKSYPIRQGQQVLISLFGIHNDPEIYPDPEKFDPDRFLPDPAKKQHPMAFLAFGVGPRMCTGSTFATSLMKALIANIICNFKLLKCDKTVERIKISPTQILPVSEDGIWCRIQKI